MPLSDECLQDEHIECDGFDHCSSDICACGCHVDNIFYKDEY